MRFNLGLRARFLGATLTLATVLLVGFAYAMNLFVETLEDQLLHGPFNEEFKEFADRYHENPDTATAPSSEGLKGYIVPKGETKDLPEPLRALKPGHMRTEIEIGAGDYVGGRRDVGAVSLYLLLDTDRVEVLEARLVSIAWVFGLTSLIVATLIALWLVRLVIRPVEQLAAQVAAIEPGRPRPPLAPGIQDESLAVIARRFDHTLARFDAYVAREQAFTEDASHELRTPLAVILSASELLAADSTLSEKSRTRLQRIETAARQGHELVEAMLFLAREEDGGKPERYHLDRIVHEAAELHTTEVAERNLYLQVHEQAQPLIVAPHGLLISVLSNLLRNAVTHTDAGGIDIYLQPDRIVIQDSGSGIDPDVLQHIFDRRVRGPQSRGEGLGLHLVKRLCERQGWQIAVSNRPVGGAQFTLLFATASYHQ